MRRLLLGVRFDGLRSRPDHARALAARGEVAYSVASSGGTASTHSDNRWAGRKRLRLRSGKIIVSTNRFLCECRIHDASSGGMRLVLMRNVGLPGRFSLHVDETGEIASVVVVWRRGGEIGVRFCAAGAAPLKPSERFALRERYYAVPDR